MSQKQQVLNHFDNVGPLTIKNANKKGIKNIGSVINRLREDGYAIYTNTNSNGVTSYRLGTASKRMVRVAMRFLGARAFS